MSERMMNERGAYGYNCYDDHDADSQEAHPPYPPGQGVAYHEGGMSGYQQPGYNPQFQNPYQNQGNQYQQQGQAPPPPPGWAPGGPPPQGFMPPPMPPRGPMGAADHHMEGGQADKYAFNFSDATIRAGFIRKVFLLVTIMLAVVAVMTAIPFMSPGVKATVRTNLGLYLGAYFSFVAVYLVLVCCESVRRSFPLNLFMTALLTLSMGYMTMMLTTRYDVVSVLLCLIITTVCCGSIIIFSVTTKRDLTSMIGIVFIFSMVLMIYGFVAIFATMFFKVKFLYTIYAALAALLFMFYLAIDVQMIMGGRKFEISPEDHVFAAIQIFIDIVYIFWMLLSLFGSSNN